MFVCCISFHVRMLHQFPCSYVAKFPYFYVASVSMFICCISFHVHMFVCCIKLFNIVHFLLCFFLSSVSTLFFLICMLQSFHVRMLQSFHVRMLHQFPCSYIACQTRAVCAASEMSCDQIRAGMTLASRWINAAASLHLLMSSGSNTRLPARLVPHSAVYAASALPMELPHNFHGQSALKVRNDIHKLKKKLHKLKNLAA
jgi:hypothetical protein